MSSSTNSNPPKVKQEPMEEQQQAEPKKRRRRILEENEDDDGQQPPQLEPDHEGEEEEKRASPPLPKKVRKVPEDTGSAAKSTTAVTVKNEKSKKPRGADPEEREEPPKPKKAAGAAKKKEQQQQTLASGASAASKKRLPKGPTNMFVAVFPQALLLKRLADCYLELTTQVQLQLGAEAITGQFMDSSHVSLCETYLDRADFEDYVHSRTVCVGVSLEQLQKAFKFIGHFAHCNLTLSAVPLSDTFRIQMNNDGAAARDFDRDVPTMDIDEEQLGVPDYTPDWVVDMSVADYKIFGACLQQCDTVHLRFTEARLQLLLYDKLSGKTNFALHSSGATPPENLEDVSEIDGRVFIQHNRTDGEYAEDFVLSLALRYMHFFEKACAVSTGRVKLIASHQHPLAIYFPIMTRSYVRYFLAPKIEEFVEDPRDSSQHLSIRSLFTGSDAPTS